MDPIGSWIERSAFRPIASPCPSSLMLYCDTPIRFRPICFNLNLPPTEWKGRGLPLSCQNVLQESIP